MQSIKHGSGSLVNLLFQVFSCRSSWRSAQQQKKKKQLLGTLKTHSFIYNKGRRDKTISFFPFLTQSLEVFWWLHPLHLYLMIVISAISHTVGSTIAVSSPLLSVFSALSPAGSCSYFRTSLHFHSSAWAEHARHRNTVLWHFSASTLYF